MRTLSEEEIAELRSRILSMARKAETGKDPLGWFEDLYESSNGNESMIPWSSGEAHQFLIEW
ncbi:MAG TPA: hypothetical protein HA314_00885, partial [Candidatus Thalassarchaeaceae archaeon]